MEQMDVTAILADMAYFTGVQAARLAQLAKSCRLIRLDAGETVFLESDPAQGLYGMVAGRVKAVRYSPQGREFVIREFEPPETFNEVGALDGGTNPATAVAAVNGTQVLLVPGEPIRRLAQEHPDLDVKLLQALTRKMRFAMQKMDQLALLEVKERLVIYLLEHDDAHDAVGRTSQEELAAQLGTVRQVLGRALAELQRCGAVQVGRGRIQVIDREALKGHLPA